MRNAAFKKIFYEAKKNKKIIFIGSDLGSGVMEEMKNTLPQQFFMEGVCEQNIVGLSAGLAMEGFVPYINTIGTFLTRRCYEQILLDVCLHKLPVRFLGNGGGGVYASLGPTHLSLDDYAILRVIPNMKIYAPCDAIESEQIIKSTFLDKSPIYIRLARGGEEIISEKDQFKPGKARVLVKNNKEKLVIFSTGITSQIAKKAAEELKKSGINISVTHFATIKPLDEKYLNKVFNRINKIIIIEEHVRSGGFGSQVLEYLNNKCNYKNINIKIMSAPDKFVDRYGNHSDLLNLWGITVKNIIKEVKKFL